MVASILCLLVVTVFHFFPYPSISCLLIGPIIAALDGGSLQLIFHQNKTHLQEQQQIQQPSNSLMRKHLSASRGWSSVLVGAIFGLALLLSPSHEDQNTSDLNNDSTTFEVPVSGDVSSQNSTFSRRKMLGAYINDAPAKHQETFLCMSDEKLSLMEVETVWKTLIVAMSIICSLAALMYLMLLLLLPRMKTSSNDSDDQENGKEKINCLRSNFTNRLRKTLDFYLSDVFIHALTPIVFFTGLHEAFMARDFINVSNLRHKLLKIRNS
jgi:hypothetical protein